MSGIDSSIYRQFAQPVKSVAEYDQERMVGQQNRLALTLQQQKADEYARGVESSNRLRGAVSGFGDDRLANQKALYKAGALKEGEEYGKATSEANKAKLEQEAVSLKNGLEQMSAVAQIMSGVRDQASADAARPLIAQLTGKPFDPSVPYVYDPAEIERGRIQATPLKEQAENRFKEIKAKLEADQFGETVRSNRAQEADRDATRAVTVRGQNMTDARSRESNATSMSKPFEATRPDGTPVLVRQDKRGQISEVEGYSPKRAPGKQMTAQQEAKYRTQIAKDYQSANTILSNMDDVAASAKAVKEAPGLGGATGLQSYLPSYPDSKASQAEVKLANLEGKVTSLGKAAAAMSGAVGPMAVQEWKIVRDMIAAVDPKKGEKSLKEQIALVEENAAGASARIRDAYDKHYSADFERYPQFEAIGGKPKTPAPAKPRAAPAKAPALPSGWSVKEN